MAFTLYLHHFVDVTKTKPFLLVRENKEVQNMGLSVEKMLANYMKY